MADSFVYCWTDTLTNKLYVGVHKGVIDDGYICSSKNMLEEYKKRSADFKRQIVAHGSYKEMLILESTILVSANAAKDPMFYNKHNGNGIPYIEKHSEAAKQKMSISAKSVSEITKKKRSDSAKIRMARDGNPSHRKDVKKKLSEHAKKRFSNGNQSGSKNHNWKGFIITPYGKFESLKEAAIAENLSKSTIFLRIRDENNLEYRRIL